MLPLGRSSGNGISDGVMQSSVLSELVGESMFMRRLRLQIQRIGPYFRTALLVGEPGTGKKTVARALHQRAHEARSTAGEFFVTDGSTFDVRDAALGFEGFPWTNALSAEPITILLENLESLSAEAQQRLIEWLEHRSVRGIHQPKLIAASCEIPSRMVHEGNLDSDLYERLAAIELTLDPLRDRTEDIIPLASHFLAGISRSSHRKLLLSDDAVQQLLCFQWPGNVGQLETALKNALALCEGDRLEARHLGLTAHDLPTEPRCERIEPLGKMVERHVKFVLERCSGNKVRAAEMLGISRSTLYRMLDEAG